MKFQSTLILKSLTAGLALLALPLGFSQIADNELESIFSRLNGNDYDARYDARMDLQDAVSKATAPGNKKQQKLVEAQLLERLETEPLLTTKLWLLRKIATIGTSQSLPVLEKLLSSEDAELADGARMAISTINHVARPEISLVLSDSAKELAELLAGDANISVKTAAFDKLSQKSPKLAAAALKASPEAEYLKIATKSRSSTLKKLALSELSSGHVERQIVVLGALSGKIPSKVETQIIALLDSDNLTLKLQAIDALARVGTLKSLDPILALISSKTRDVSEAAADAIAALDDSRIDRKLLNAVRKGETEARISALRAMSYRASKGVSALVNSIAADSSLDEDLRTEAIESMVLVGNEESLPLLVKVILDEKDSGLRRDAQKAIKRMTLRIGNPDAAWNAFKAGFEAATDTETQIALIMVSDSASTDDCVDYLLNAYDAGNDDVKKAVLRVLPIWRNLGGGKGIMTLLEKAGSDEKLRLQCFKGIGSLILGSDETYPIPDKFALAESALAEAKNDKERKAVTDGFRYVTWKDKRYANGDNVSAELKAAVAAGENK